VWFIEQAVEDYNNDPTTTLADVQSSLSEALRVMTDPEGSQFATG
jgi:hypothetical protein